ncbi:ROK family transcriptional regulator [Labilibacter sediminis]|nr:ROK family transcriptional regulator [Labilibacter sediminis]
MKIFHKLAVLIKNIAFNKMKYWNPEIQKSLSGQEKKKFLSKRKIVRYLYRQGMLSGAEIAKILNLSSPTTQTYLNELIEENFIEYKGKGESIGGRRPNVYGLVKNSVYLLGIDISQNSFSVAVYNNDLQIISGTHSKDIILGQDVALVDEISEFAKNVILESGIDKEKIMGVGINIPGLVDSQSGVSYSYLNSGKKSVQVLFEEKFNIPVYVENDSKARALAELRHGAVVDSKNALVIQLDWGVGMGMIMNGKLYRGNSGFAGEFSHVLIEEEGQLCTCGKRGCLETIASGRAIVKQATQELERNSNSALHRIISEENKSITPIDIIQAAKEGDQLAISLINNMGQKLGKGISYLIQVLNPEQIILGGAVSQADEYLLTPINQSLFTYCIPKLREDTQIKISQLGIEAGLLGAISVVLERLIESK